MADVVHAVTAIREKLRETPGQAKIPKVRGGHFTAKLAKDGVYVDNLGRQPFLPWAVFREAVWLLMMKGGRAVRGDAMRCKLGDPGLPTESVEGHIARVVYRKTPGDSVFRRITPIACTLIWAGACEHVPGGLALVGSYAAPFGFWKRAKEFLNAGDLVMAQSQSQLSRSMVAYYLYCHGLELALKAFLRAKGVKTEKLKRVHGHDLRKVLGRCDRLGLREFVDMKPEQRGALEQVAPSYVAKTFEYPRPGMASLPLPDCLREVLALLLNSTKSMVRTATVAQTGG